MVIPNGSTAVDPFGITIPAGAGETAVEGRGLKSTFTEGYDLQAELRLLAFPIHAFSDVFTLDGEIRILGGGCRGFISQLPLRRSRQ